MFERKKTVIHYHRVPLDVMDPEVENGLVFETNCEIPDSINKFMLENQSQFQDKMVVIDYIVEEPLNEEL